MMSLFSDATLCSDADLSAQESRMPDAARAVRTPSGNTAYDGKIDLAKELIGKKLRKLRVFPDALTDPSQLKRAAVYKSLELCFRDMASRNDSVSWDKAKHYCGLFEDEMDTLQLDYDNALVPESKQSAGGVTSIPLALA
jgi:hypothetical protein